MQSTQQFSAWSIGLMVKDRKVFTVLLILIYILEKYQKSTIEPLCILTLFGEYWIKKVTKASVEKNLALCLLKTKYTNSNAIFGSRKKSY